LAATEDADVSLNILEREGQCNNDNLDGQIIDFSLDVEAGGSLADCLEFESLYMEVNLGGMPD